MGYMNSYYKLVDDIKTREDAVKKVKKTQSNSYEDSELCATDSLVLKKFEDGIKYINDAVGQSFKTADNFATSYDYKNTSSSLGNLHDSVVKTVNTSLQPTMLSVEDASREAYRLVGEDFDTEMQSVATNIETCWDKAEIVKTDCSNLDNYDEKTSEHTLSEYENRLYIDLRIARSALNFVDEHLENVEDILNDRGFKLAGAENVNLNTIPEMLAGDFSVFGENAETVESIFTKTGIDPLSDEGQALWKEIDALIKSNPKNAASKLKNIADNIPESWNYWKSEETLDKPLDIQDTVEGYTPNSQYYLIDGILVDITIHENDNSNTPILDTIMNKTAAYSALDHIKGYPYSYSRVLDTVAPYVRLNIGDMGNLPDSFINSSSSPDYQREQLDNIVARTIWNSCDLLQNKDEKFLEALNAIDPQKSNYENFRTFVTQDLASNDKLVTKVGQDNYNAVIQTIGECTVNPEIEYRSEITSGTVIINKVFPDGSEEPYGITIQDKNGQNIFLVPDSAGISSSTQFGAKSDGHLGIKSETFYHDGIKDNTVFYDDIMQTDCTLYYGSPDSPQDKLVIPNTVRDSSGTPRTTAELTITGGTVTVTYLGINGKPLPEEQDYEKYWAIFDCDVSGTTEHFDEMGEKYNNLIS